MRRPALDRFMPIAILLLGLLAAAGLGSLIADRAEQQVLGRAFVADAVGLSEELGVDWAAEGRRARRLGFVLGSLVPLGLAGAVAFWTVRRSRKLQSRKDHDERHHRL